MSVDLAAAAEEWLAERRARGYRLKDHGWLIADFLDSLAARGANTITVADALAFARARPAQPRWQATRLRVVAGLAAHVHSVDPTAAELIPRGLVRAKTARRLPYLYSTGQVSQLMTATADVLSPALLAASVRILIGLLAATGLRSGEALSLDVEDLKVDESLLMVTGKYAMQRLVPLHPTTVDALAAYRQMLDPRAASSGPLLVGARGGRLNPKTARAAFRRVANECRLPSRPGCGTPRLHDLRHTFTVNALLDAHRQGADVDARLATLATYLGHVEPANTYWYLTASAELMTVVAQRADAASRRCRP